MLDPRNATDLPLLVDAVIDGGITASDAAHGTPPQIQTLFEIAEHLGNLGRGHPVDFTSAQAEMLHDLIETGIGIVFGGRRPTTPGEKIATRMMDLAFEIDDPLAWAFNLCAARDGSMARVVRS